MPHTPSAFYPRILYILAGIAWVLLLWPNPWTVFMAGCVACHTLPYFRRLRRRFRLLRRHLEQRNKAFSQNSHCRICRTLFARWIGLCQGFANAMPLTLYLMTIIMALAVPVAVLTILVAPQVGAGLSGMHALWSNNFQLPQEWIDYLNEIMERFHEMPFVDKILREIQAWLDKLSNYASNFNTDTITSVVNHGFNVVGGTMSVAWTCFLFLFLTVIFSLYAARIHLLTARILHIRPVVLHRFILAIRQALRGIILGVVFVAIIQGVLCGIGFAMVGIKQFAFWGLMATLVAPIPMIGTALVWLPLCLQLWFTGETMSAVGLALWGSLFVSTADSVLRPLFLKKGIRATYLVLILVILCGIASFGAVGLILGPVLLAFSIQAMEEGNAVYPTVFGMGKKTMTEDGE